MCKVLDEIEKKGKLEILNSLIKKGLLTIKQAAEELGMTPKKLETALNNLAKSTQKS